MVKKSQNGVVAFQSTSHTQCIFREKVKEVFLNFLLLLKMMLLEEEKNEMGEKRMRKWRRKGGERAKRKKKKNLTSMLFRGKLRTHARNREGRRVNIFDLAREEGKREKEKENEIFNF